MKAIAIPEPYKIDIIDMPMPEAKAGEALLQVLFCGICGADVASFTGNQPFTTYPRIPGHEFSARIVSVPKNDKGLKAGDVITCNPYFNCGTCYACRKGLVNACEDNQTMGVQRDGAYREFITMPVERLIPGHGMSGRRLALIEPFAIGQHAISRCEIHEGDRLVIMGAGPIGTFALMAAKAKGAEVTICDLLDGRLENAKSFGADHTVNTGKDGWQEQLAQFTGGRGFDVCVEACGRPEAFLNCIDQACQGANIILIGNGKKETTFVHSILLKKELNVFGSRNAFTRDFDSLIAMVSESGLPLEKMISAEYDYPDAAKAFDALVHNDGSLEKVLLRFAGDRNG